MKSKFYAFLLVMLVMHCGAADYEKAWPGYRFEFPRDHFNHPNYQTEWWYYTGNLKAADGHRFGFELTFFRQAVNRDSNGSTWNIDDLYMAHLALSDLEKGRFYRYERINRAGPGIAGIDERTGMIWNGNWQVHLTDAEQSLVGIADKFDLQLTLVPAKPAVINGRDGISRKAEGDGQASHYISFTRLLTSGRIELEGASYQVDGSSWMDHEFFTEAMDANQAGWDWISLQLNDNTELMIYRLRHRDGRVDPYSSGSYIDRQGKCVFLSRSDFSMTPAGETWTSPETKGSYPIRWHVTIPRLKLEADISTPLRTQELVSRFGPSYWEGAIDVNGQENGVALRGVGYLEMTGYAAVGRLDLGSAEVP